MDSTKIFITNNYCNSNKEWCLINNNIILINNRCITNNYSIKINKRCNNNNRTPINNKLDRPKDNNKFLFRIRINICNNNNKSLRIWDKHLCNFRVNILNKWCHNNIFKEEDIWCKILWWCKVWWTPIWCNKSLKIKND